MKRRSHFNLGYFIWEGAHSIFTHGLMSFAAVCMIVACLIIMGCFTLVAVNADQMMGQLENENEFLAYIEETYTDSQINALQEKLEGMDNIRSITFITKEDAKASFLEGREDQGLYASLPDSVFRDRFSIQVVELVRFEETVDQVELVKGIADTYAAAEMAEWFVTIRNVASALATILVGILVIISLFIMANTIRLATFTRREEIAIMRICGATNWFIRWPFIIEGLLLGLMGAAVAFVLQWIIYVAVYNAIVSSGAITLFDVLPFQIVATSVLGWFLLAGALIGAVGSGLSISRFLRK